MTHQSTPTLPIEKIISNELKKMRGKKTPQQIAQKIIDKVDGFAGFTEEGEFFAYDGGSGVWESKNVRIFLKQVFGTSQTRKNLEEIAYHLQYSPELQINEDDFDNCSTLIVVANGVLDLKTLTLKPFDASIKATKSSKATWAPNSPAGRFSAFLGSIMDTPEQEYIQCHAGTGLTTIVPESMLLLQGNGANGKSTLLQAIANVIPSTSFISASFFSSTEPRKDMEAAASRFVVCEEMPSARLNATTIKLFTGTGGRVSSERKFKNAREIEVHASTIVALNTLPQPSEFGHGMKRRLNVLPLEKTFSGSLKKTINLKDDATMSEILLWLAQGASYVLNGVGIEQTEKMKETKEKWWHDATLGSAPAMVEDFFAENIESTDESSYMYFTPIVKEFAAYCKALGIKPPKAKEVSEKIEHMGYEITTRKPKKFDVLSGAPLATGAKKIFGIKWAGDEFENAEQLSPNDNGGKYGFARV